MGFYAQYPASASGSNSSVGVNGAPIPSDSTLIAGEDPSGNLKPVAVEADGSVRVSITSGITNPLPVTDAAAEASLASIDTKTTSVVTNTGTIATNTGTTATNTGTIATNTGTTATNTGTIATNTGNTATSVASIDTKTPTVGQKAMAASSPVVIASDQSAIPVSGTVTVNQPVAVTQSGTWNINNVSGTVSLPTGAATESTLSTLNTKVPAQGQALMAASLPVAIASNQSTLPVSAASLPLPSGAATETTLSAINTKTPALGQAVMANSTPVVLSSDQSSIPVTQLSTVSTANSSTTPLGISGVFTGTSESVQNYASIEVSVFANQASATNGLSVQQSQDGTNWDFTDTYTVPASTGKVYSFAPAARFYRVVYTNGTSAQATFRLMTVLHYATPRSSTHSLADTITLQNDAELQIAQMRATNGTNSVPLTASASSNLNVNISEATATITTSAGGKTVSTAPVYTLYTSTPVSTSAYTTLVASTTGVTSFINIFDSSGQGMIIATGAAASEVIKLYVPPGGGEFPLAIPASTRIAIKALTANATTGYNLLNLMI